MFLYNHSFTIGFGQDVSLEPNGTIVLELGEAVNLTCLVLAMPANVERYVFLQHDMVVQK